jgi:hypothetical protein
MTAKSLHLRLPTNRTDSGPRLQSDARRTAVEYDFQHHDGTKSWSAVVFEDVLQVELRPMPCCTADDVIAPTEVRVRASSDRLLRILSRWREAVGWQKWQQSQGGAERYKHFTLFFDDAGCVDVIAAIGRPSQTAAYEEP